MSSNEETLSFSPEPSLSASSLPFGTPAGEYMIEEPIARGGCGTIYSARRPGSRERVALKVLHDELSRSPRMVERFLREIDVVQRLGHPGIVAIHGSGALPDGRPFYVMERLEGMTLDELLRSQGRVSPEQ